MTTDFRDIRPTADSSRLPGEESAVKGRRIRRSGQTLLDGAEDGSLESSFALPSVRAEAGALLERQLLISGGLEARLPRPPGDGGSRRIGLVFGLFVLAVLGAGAAFHARYRNMQEELRGELGLRSEELAAARTDNERLLRENNETGLRLAQTAAELSREVTEKRRIAREADSTRTELKVALKDMDSLRSEIGGLMARYRKLEAERLAELGAFLRDSFLLPLRGVRSMASLSAATEGPLPKAAATGRVEPLVRSPRDFTERTVSPTRGETAAPSEKDE